MDEIMILDAIIATAILILFGVVVRWITYNPDKEVKPQIKKIYDVKIADGTLKKFKFIHECLKNRLMYVYGMAISVSGYDDGTLGVFYGMNQVLSIGTRYSRLRRQWKLVVYTIDWKHTNAYDGFISAFVDGDENKLVEKVMSMIDEIYERMMVDDNVILREISKTL